MSRVVVRRVHPDDWAAFRETRLAALADSPSAFLTTLDQARASTEEDWRSRAAAGGTMLAWCDGRPVGIVGVYVHANLPELVMTWVEPQFRGRGVVEALVGAVTEWARRRTFEELRLWVVEGNERAQSAYARYGFRRTGRRQPVPGRPGETELEMSLAVGGSQMGAARNGEL